MMKWLHRIIGIAFLLTSVGAGVVSILTLRPCISVKTGLSNTHVKRKKPHF